MVSSLFSIFILLIECIQLIGNKTMAIEKLDSMGFQPLGGTVSGNFIQLPQCGGSGGARGTVNSNTPIFEVHNNCSFTVWAAAIPGGGQQLHRNDVWRFNVNASTVTGRIWARTSCNFNGSGRGRCQTGDCEGLLQCQGYGDPPNTLAEYAFNQVNNLDFFAISLVDGFNVPMDFNPTTNRCRGPRACTADINGQCPSALRAPGGCNNPCTIFKTNEYCCNSGSCGQTDLSRFFKDSCPDAFSYPKDDSTSTFYCPSGTDYRVVFCP